MKILMLCIFVSIGTCLFGHESYFSFAEMQYDTSCSCIEITVTLSAHDLEAYAKDEKLLSANLESGLENEMNRQTIVQGIILEGMKIKQNRQEVKLSYEGYELFEDGRCSFYLKSDMLSRTECSLFYGLFMNYYPEQQNKLTYKKENNQTVYNFFVFKRENAIEL